MIDRIIKSFHAVAVLRDVAVVFTAGADPLGLRVFGHSPRICRDYRQHSLKADESVAHALRRANVMAHDLRPQGFGNVDLTAKSCDLGVICLSGTLVEIRAHGVRHDLDAVFLGLTADLGGIGKLLLRCRRGNGGKIGIIHTRKA